MIGFHVFSGSQILSSEGIIHHFAAAWTWPSHGRSSLASSPKSSGPLGGGFGVYNTPRNASWIWTSSTFSCIPGATDGAGSAWCSSWAVTL